MPAGRRPQARVQGALQPRRDGVCYYAILAKASCCSNVEELWSCWWSEQDAMVGFLLVQGGVKAKQPVRGGGGGICLLQVFAEAGCAGAQAP